MMRRIGIVLVLATVVSAAAAGQRATAVDGDTIKVRGQTVRVVGMDAPEKRGRCPAEKWLARVATERMGELVAAGVTLERHGRDKYGRVLARVFDADGHDVALVLISEGLARPYDGRTKRLSWCEPGERR